MDRRVFIKKLMVTSIAVSPLIAHPETIWAQEKVYMTEEQALKMIFAKSERIVKEEKILSNELRPKVEVALGARLSTDKHLIYRGETAGSTDGYAMILNELGKDQFITFIVGVSNQFKIQKIALMVFRETRGWEVKDARFTNQFVNKTTKDRLLVGADIVGITGATLSVRAFCRGSKKALLLCEALYK